MACHNARLLGLNMQFSKKRKKTIVAFTWEKRKERYKKSPGNEILSKRNSNCRAVDQI